MDGDHQLSGTGSVTVFAPNHDLTVTGTKVPEPEAVESDDGRFRLTGVLTVETEHNDPRPGTTAVYMTRQNGNHVRMEGRGIRVVDVAVR